MPVTADSPVRKASCYVHIVGYADIQRTFMYKMTVKFTDSDRQIALF